MVNKLDFRAPYIVFAVLLLLPFVNILHFALPLPPLFGKSTWLVMAVVTLIIIYIWVDRPWVAGRWRLQSPQLIAAGILLPVCLVRSFAYDEPAIPSYLRFAVTMIVYLGLAEAMLNHNKAALSVLSRALVLQGLLVSVLVFFNMNFFPGVRIESDEHGLIGLTTEGFLTRSMLINASIGANCFRPYKTGPSALVIHRLFFSKQPWG